MSDEERSQRAYAMRMHLMRVHGYTPLRVSDMLDAQAEATHWDDHASVVSGDGALARTMDHTEPAALHDQKEAALDDLLQRGQDSMLRTLEETIDVEARLAELHQKVQKSEPARKPQPMTGLQQHLLDVHKNEAAGNLTMTQALAYHAQEHLGVSGIRNHSEPGQLHRALAYQLAEIQGLEVPKDDIVNFLDQVLEGKIRGDHEDERAAIENVLNRHPDSWTARTQPQPKTTFRLWKASLSRSDQFSHCGNAEPHMEHKHDIHMTGEFIPNAPCVGTPVLMTSVETQPPLGDMPDVNEAITGERARATREGSQPLPIPRADVAGAHDMVLSDLRGIMTRRQVALRNAGKTVEAETIRKLLKEIEADLLQRRALGLERYGSLLQPGNGRDPLRDAYEEIVDLVAYFRQLIMARDEAVTLLTELLQDHAIGEDPVLRENVGRVMYLLAGEIKKGSNDG